MKNQCLNMRNVVVIEVIICDPIIKKQFFKTMIMLLMNREEWGLAHNLHLLQTWNGCLGKSSQNSSCQALGQMPNFALYAVHHFAFTSYTLFCLVDTFFTHTASNFGLVLTEIARYVVNPQNSFNQSINKRFFYNLLN